MKNNANQIQHIVCAEFKKDNKIKSSGDLIAKQAVAQLGKQLVSYLSDLQERMNVEQLVPQFIHISFRQKLAKLLPEKFQLSLPSIEEIEEELGGIDE
ncbi:MAG: hypothetical protein KAQ93_09135 [Spirochaetales bacterium]|nr:hypothetical protein [Spirochaetales bacterium]